MKIQQQKVKQVSKTSNKYSVDFLAGNIVYDKLLVKPLEVEVSTNGLATSVQYEDKPEFGEVIMVGEGIMLENGTIVPLKFKKGDVVFFEKYSSKKVRVGGVDYLIIRADDIDWYINNNGNSKPKKVTGF